MFDPDRLESQSRALEIVG